MNATRPVTLHVIASDEEASATHRVHLLMRQRETLRPMFRAAWDTLSHHYDATELEAWAGAVLTLAHVNAGPACLIAYWEASKNGADRQEIAPLLAAGQTSADICRHAGAQAATAALQALAVAAKVLGHGPALSRWWRMMDALARQAPESTATVAGNMGEILAPGTIDAFENFVGAGLKFGSGNKVRRLAFFSLQDELARRMIARDLGSVGLAETEVELKAFVTLKPHKGERETIELTLPIPADFAEGPHEAIFCDASNSVRRQFRNDPALLEPRDLTAVLRSLRTQTEPKRTAVYFHVPSMERGVSIRGQALPNLPGSVRAVFASRREVPVAPIRSDMVKIAPTSWVLEGSHTLRFTVAKDAGLSVSLYP